MAKKNIRSIPKPIRNRLTKLGKAEVVAGVSRAFTTDDLKKGALQHLGVKLDDRGLHLPPATVPPAAGGKFSDRNVNGYEVVRRDLPKETHYKAVEAPDWKGYGTHTVHLPYEKFPRDFHSPKFLSIKITSPSTEANLHKYTIIFEVDQVLDPKDADFEADLLELLNLLQENVGACGVQKSDATVADYLKSTVVDWEVLPPGTKEEAIARLFRARPPTPQERGIVEERYDFLMALNPEELVYGMSGNSRYFGAMIEKDLVVFENIEYGNAIYIMFEDWKELSKRSRTELLSGRFGDNFERIPHGSTWKSKVKAAIKRAQKNKAGGKK